MENLFTGEELAHLRRDLHRQILFCILFPAMALVVCVVLCFFVTDENATPLLIVNIVLSSAGGCVSLFWLFNVVSPRAARCARVRELATGASQTVRGTVCGNGGELTLRRGLGTREVILRMEEGGERMLFWDTEKPSPPPVGERVILRVVGSVIVGCEVAK